MGIGNIHDPMYPRRIDAVAVQMGDGRFISKLSDADAPMYAHPASQPDGTTEVWSGRWESNPRHSAWEADVLPLNYARVRIRIVAAGGSGLKGIIPHASPDPALP